MRKIALIAATALLALGAQAQVALQIYGTVPDTVTTATRTIVAVTQPGATATINGQAVKVYPTGSFGADVALEPGMNHVTIAVADGADTATETLNIYRAEPKAKEAKAAAAPVPQYVTTLPGAYLQYGNGGDRLGGSKMGFVADGVTMRVLGTDGELYKVALSENRWAYLPMEYAEAATKAAPGIVNTGTWSVSNQGTFDRVTINLPARLPYRYYTLIDPSTIVVELFGATDNSNWIVQKSIDLGMIDYVDFNQVESDVYAITLHLKEQYQWGFSVGYGEKGSLLTIDVRHAPKSLNWKDLTIGLDAGHGGQYPGAISFSGIKEKEVNLDIVNRLKALLEKAGATVVMTRTDDSGPSMSERKRIWRDAHVDLAVSVHNNAGCNALSSPGTSTYYKHLFDRPMAESVLRRLLETGLPMFGLTGNFNFSLNGPTDYPNILVEGMFMSSLEEEAKLADPKFRQLFAEKIFAGLNDYLAAVRKSKK